MIVYFNFPTCTTVYSQKPSFQKFTPCHCVDWKRFLEGIFFMGLNKYHALFKNNNQSVVFGSRQVLGNLEEESSINVNSIIYNDLDPGKIVEILTIIKYI